MLSLLLYVAAYSPVPDVCSPVTEAWYVYVDKQVPYGSEHVVKRSLANGDVEYRIETRVLIDLLGTRQEESTTAPYVFRPAPAFRPLSMRVNIYRLSGPVEVSRSGVIQSSAATARPSPVPFAAETYAKKSWMDFGPEAE